MEIDIYTVIWTVISFFILYFLLNVLLYKPLLSFMDRRKAAINEGFAREREAQEKLEAARGLAEDRIRRANEEATSIIRDSKQKDRQQYDEQIRQAHSISSELIRQAGSDMHAEEQRQLEEVDRNMPELVCALAEKLLGSSVSLSENEALVRSNLKETEQGG